MKYDIGDRVRIKSLDWYNENKNELGQIDADYTIFIPRMAEYCGKEATIFSVEIDNYVLEGIPYTWTDEMIEGLVEEETKNWTDVSIPDGPYTVTYDSPSINDSMNKNNINNEIILPKGYIFKDENGNVINATKIILEKNEYPKTYEECCGIIGFCSDALKWNNPFYINRDTHPYIKHLDNLIESFIKLKVCRDAYWKIAGDEMGLGKPWEPDWKNSEEKRYSIVNIEGDINLPEKTLTKWILKVTNKILVFPTEEMRDTFYENFKELVEQCKELL